MGSARLARRGVYPDGAPRDHVRRVARIADRQSLARVDAPPRPAPRGVPGLPRGADRGPRTRGVPGPLRDPVPPGPRRRRGDPRAHGTPPAPTSPRAPWSPCRRSSSSWASARSRSCSAPSSRAASPRRCSSSSPSCSCSRSASRGFRAGRGAAPASAARAWASPHGLFALAATSSGGAGYDFAVADSVAVAARDFAFGPADVPLAAGGITEIVVANEDGAFHPFTDKVGERPTTTTSSPGARRSSS